MPIPLKVPVEWALESLNADNRGFVQPEQITNLDNLVQQHMVRVASLKDFFENVQAYQRFKNRILVPRRYWELAIRNDPANRTYARRQIRISPSSPAASANGSRPPSRSASPTRRRRRSASPPHLPQRPKYRRGELVMTTKLGDDFTAQEIAGAPLSLMSIEQSGDECDDTDVNLPLPACRAINKVCRNYNSLRQYAPFVADGTEHSNYRLRVKYNNNNNNNNRRRNSR